ncbi:MAG: hypothetical protein DMG03_06540 [Acidobacteria bacterium]|nr:MAG: hypothetical protein DMG03_06540 [Acidobacteriota bacterium]
MKVRIKETPREQELDGVRLDSLRPGSTRDVSLSIGAWLIAEGYAEPEMRRGPREEQDFSGVKETRASAPDERHPRRRSTDR